jgi:hypothetical protein
VRIKEDCHKDVRIREDLSAGTYVVGEWLPAACCVLRAVFRCGWIRHLVIQRRRGYEAQPNLCWKDSTVDWKSRQRRRIWW